MTYDKLAHLAQVASGVDAFDARANDMAEELGRQLRSFISEFDLPVTTDVLIAITLGVSLEATVRRVESTQEARVAIAAVARQFLTGQLTEDHK